MKNTKLHELLINLSANELKSFEKFLASPYNNSNEKIRALYKYITWYSPSFTSDDLDKQAIFRYLYPDEEFKEKRIDLLFSDLKSLIEKFLVNEKLVNNNIDFKTVLLSIFREKGCRKNFVSLVNEIDKRAEKEFNKTIEFYYSNVKKEYELSQYEYIKKFYSSEASFKALENDTDLFIVSVKLISFILIYKHQKEVDTKINYKAWFEKEIISFIQENLTLIRREHAVIFILYLILMTLIHPEEEAYYKSLKKFVIKNIYNLNADILRDTLIQMTNYCNDRTYSNPVKFSKELFEIYEMLDKNNLFIIKKYIEQTDFINAVIASLVVNNTKWAYNFLNRYKNKLNPEIKEDTFSLVNAELYFREKKYEKALEELNNIKSNVFYFYIRIKVIRIKIYNELNEEEALNYVIDSVKHYLARNRRKVSSIYSSGMKYLNYVRKLLKYRVKPIQNKITKTIIQLEKETGMASKLWLLEKFNELK